MRQARQTRPARGESRRKNLRRKRAAQALAAGAAIAGGTQAYAAPVRFDNPPGAEHFDWFGSPVSLRWLDLTSDHTSQNPGANPPSAFQQEVGFINSIVRATDWGDVEIGADGYSLQGVDAGVLIPSGLAWRSQGDIYYPGYGSYLPEGEATYLGVRFDLGGGYQYAWIGVVRTGLELDAFAWGYETEAGVLIGAGVPEPGTLAMLAVGAAAMAGRRRRSA